MKMSVKFTAKDIKLPGALKAFTERNLRSIEKIGGDMISAEVIVNQQRLDFRVEIILRTKLHSYHVEDRDPILKQALRKSLASLKVQAKKNKEKLKLDKKRMKKRERAVPPQSVATEPLPDSTGDQVTLSQNFSAKPNSLEEAIFYLKDSGENAYMFMNAETNRMSVVFFNKQNGISIIEAK
jgi:putative sigma-54 modulation protein